MAEEDKEREDSGEDAVAFVAEQMKAGADEESIVAMLQERGVERGEAQQLVGSVYPELMRAAEAEEYSSEALLPGLAGGILAAIVGGVVWGLIVILTDYEVGFVAWGIGFLAGFLVVRFAGGRKGVPLQAIAIVSSLVGIVLGKYIAYVYFLKEAVREQIRRKLATASDISIRTSCRRFERTSATSSAVTTSCGPGSPSSPLGAWLAHRASGRVSHPSPACERSGESRRVAFALEVTAWQRR